MSDLTCHECESSDLHEFKAYRELGRVTSDCKAWPSGGRLNLCRNCGLLQTPVTPEWSAECDRIYRDYSVYYQSGGIEQAVFDAETGEPMPRSEKLVASLVGTLDLQPQGRLLDAGCGNGGFLKACAKVLTDWQYAGAELSEKYREDVLQIPGVRDFFAMDLRDIPAGFSAISMIHLLEHVPNPGGLLRSMGKKLDEGGFVFVQVPTPTENPFELLIADHCSHFTASSLQNLALQSGLDPVNRDNFGWLPKELSLIATPKESESNTPNPDTSEQIAQTEKTLSWLKLVMSQAKELAADQPIAVFGTSIAANWLVGCLGEDGIACFLDEDPSRKNTRHLGKPVYTPDEVPSGVPIFVPLAPQVAASIQNRLHRLDLVIPATAALN